MSIKKVGLLASKEGKTFFENNYTSLHCLQWEYFYSFEATYNDIALFYTTLIGITPAVSTTILTSFKNSTANTA